MWNNPVYNEPPDEEYRRLMRRLNKNARAAVVHHETCPVCGKKLVNLYARKNNISGKNDWRCRTCWEAYDAAPPEKTRIQGSISKMLGGRFTDMSTVDPDILLGKPVVRKVNNANVVVGTITELDIEKDTWYADIEVRHEKV